MSYTKSTNIIIYETTDYSQFKFFDENRKLTYNHELEWVLLHHNRLRYHPIHVTPDLKVIDGQHRLKIAEAHQLPIYYIICEDGGKEDIQAQNVGRKNWTQYDHLHFFDKMGREDYQGVKKLLDKCTIPISIFLKHFTVRKSKVFDRSFRRGEMQLTKTIDQIEKNLSDFQEIFEKFKYFSHSLRMSAPFQNVILQLVKHPEYSHQRMMRNIDQYPELEPIHKKIAQAQGGKKWEDLCRSSANGENKSANTASLQMIMRNVCGWDKKEEEEKDTSTLSTMSSDDVKQAD